MRTCLGLMFSLAVVTAPDMSQTSPRMKGDKVVMPPKCVRQELQYSPPSQWQRLPELVSIICPVFKEERGVAHFAESLMAVMQSLSLPFEIIFVEDDSPDASLEVIRDLHRKYPAVVKALSLSRRFGHQSSLSAGLRYAAGDVVVCMDSDMQHPPSLIPLMLWKWSQGNQLVYTRRRSQAGRNWLTELMSRTFYRVMDLVCDVHFEQGTADFRLMDRIVVQALNQFGENFLLYRGLVNWVGFRRTAVEYDAAERFAGTSSYSLNRMMRMAVDSLFAFSLLPLRIGYLLGFLSLLCSLGYAIWVLLDWLVGGKSVPGYTSIVLLVVFMGSLNLLCLGVIGEYIGRIHEQVKGRPLFLVKEWIGLDGSADKSTRFPLPHSPRAAG